MLKIWNSSVHFQVSFHIIKCIFTTLFLTYLKISTFSRKHQVMNFLCLTTFTILSFLFPVPSLSGDVSCDKICPQWEVYSRCAGPNQPNCSNRSATTDEPQCMPGCVCTRGMIRDPNTFTCISEHKCPNPANNPKWCPLNEVYSDCLAGCQRTCETLNVAFKCRCVSGCVCKDGHVRSQITSQCVPIKSCKGITIRFSEF